jgi:hypothetical protein
MIYLAGSLRNPRIPEYHKALEHHFDGEVFSDWYAAGPEADDHWKAYEQSLGNDYMTGLEGHAAKNVFNFDKKHIDRAQFMVLALPAGKSGHLELGYFLGTGRVGIIQLDETDVRWDVMYQFASHITRNIHETIDVLSGCGMK